MHGTDNIIKSCLAQNRKGQRELYDLLLPYLLAVARRYIKDNSFVKDVLQESFVKIYQNLNVYDSKKAPLKQWAARILINTCINFNKKNINKRDIEYKSNYHEIAVLPAIFHKLTNDHILSIIKKMPKDHYEVFSLYEIDGYKHKEIAKLLAITETLSKKRLSRARAWLKKTFPSNSELNTGLKNNYLS